MKKLSILIITVVFLIFHNISAQSLRPELQCFEKLVNHTWIGKFDIPGDKRIIRLKMEVILGGNAILESQYMPSGDDFGSQKLIYWDPESKSIQSLRITNNKWTVKSTSEVKDGVIINVGKRFAPDGAETEVQSKRIIHGEDKWIEEGGHTIIYRKESID